MGYAALLARFKSTPQLWKVNPVVPVRARGSQSDRLTSMPATRDWRDRNRWIADLLKQRTGDDIETWNVRVRESGAEDETSLREWLTKRGVTGYPQMLLVMERLGYPDFLLATADELVERQYADRPALRPIYEAILAKAGAVGEVAVQTRKTYVSLLTPRRTFAAVQATTKQRVDIGLRLAHPAFGGRLEAAKSMGSDRMTARIGLSSVQDVDDEVESWLRRAYAENT